MDIYGMLDFATVTTFMTCDRSQRTLKRHQLGRAQMQPHKIQSILGNNVGTWAPGSLAISVLWRYCLYAPCIYENLYDIQMISNVSCMYGVSSSGEPGE